MKRVTRWAPVFMLIVAMGIAVAGQAKVAVGALAGTVLDAHAKPVVNATVTMQTSYGTRPHATHTDESGKFKFARFQTGQYDLRAYSEGVFSDWTKRVSIHAGKTTEVTIHLPVSIPVEIPAPAVVPGK